MGRKENNERDGEELDGRRGILIHIVISLIITRLYIDLFVQTCKSLQQQFISVYIKNFDNKTKGSSA